MIKHRDYVIFFSNNYFSLHKFNNNIRIFWGDNFYSNSSYFNVNSWQQISQWHNLLLSLCLKMTWYMNYLISYRKCQLSDEPNIIYDVWVHSTSNCLTYHWRCSEQRKRVYIKDFVVLPRTSFLQDAGHASICWRKLHGGNVPKRTWYKFNVLYLHSGIVKLTLCTSEERCSLQKLYTLLYRGNPRAFLMLACATP